MRACSKFPRWGADAGQVRLHLVVHAPGGDEPTAEAEAAALEGRRLQSGWTLERAGVLPGAWLLARVPPAEVAAALPPPAADVVELLRAYLPGPLSHTQAYALRFHASFFEERAALAAGGFEPRRAAGLAVKLRNVLSSATRARFALRSGIVLDGPVGGGVGQAGTSILLALRGARVLCAKVGPRAAVYREWEVSQAVHARGARPAPAVARALACEDLPTERGLAALLLPLYPLTVAAAEAALPRGAGRARNALALSVALGGLAAVAAFAAAGWAHGDIKPANIMLVGGDAEACVLIDFGTARPRGEAFSEGSAFSLAEERTACAGFDLVCLGATLAAVQHEVLIAERGMTRASLLADVRRLGAVAAAAGAPRPPASLAAERCLELGARADVSGEEVAALEAEIAAAAAAAAVAEPVLPEEG